MGLTVFPNRPGISKLKNYCMILVMFVNKGTKDGRRIMAKTEKESTRD